MDSFTLPLQLAVYEKIRSDCYVILASLLIQPPSEDLFHIIRNLKWDSDIPDKLNRALSELKQAGLEHTPSMVENEFNRLFIGIGHGEVVPYASWYREKKIQSSTLALLRSTLMSLGMVRRETSHESEDHAAAICEIMAIISLKRNKVPLPTQARFFQKHLAPWMSAFFHDLRLAKSADFYQLVGLLGSCLIDVEEEFLKQNSDDQIVVEEGGAGHEKSSYQQQADIH